MTPQDQLRHAPRARDAYQHFVYLDERTRRLDTTIALLGMAFLCALVALPFILFYGDLLP
jgi:hypothetical protein